MLLHLFPCHNAAGAAHAGRRHAGHLPRLNHGVAFFLAPFKMQALPTLDDTTLCLWYHTICEQVRTPNTMSLHSSIHQCLFFDEQTVFLVVCCLRGKCASTLLTCLFYILPCFPPIQARLGLPTIGLAPVEHWAPVSGCSDVTFD